MFILFSVKFERQETEMEKANLRLRLDCRWNSSSLALINRLALFFEGLQSWQVESGAL